MKDLNHLTYEPEIFKLWEQSGVFKGKVDPSKEPFCVVIPPPNVTGILHMGHVLDSIPQDVMTRWHRMRGFATVWIPGTDHAGIATQNVVKRQVEQEGETLESLGREAFIERIWKFKEKHGQVIINQLKRLGCSCDWERERFTLDEGLASAVNHAFVQLYKKDLVYRGLRMVNWCVSCRTALSDDEVEHEDRKSELWEIHYPLEEKFQTPARKTLIVATTRPETMLGDVAVAVHPNDERYKDLIGANVILPIVNKAIPIIADEMVDISFGTGAVKITPAHDKNDYEVALRHKLSFDSVIDDCGVMTKNAGTEFAGKDRFTARTLVVEKLTELELLEKSEKHNNRVGLCYRCKNIIEPKVSEQWFVKMRPLAEKAAEAVRSGKITVVPESEKNDFFHWMNTIQDWCISRQLWWGHRIPVHYCEDCNHLNVAVEKPNKCEKCSSEKLRQDDDVLDTWFSSQLWPFSTLGWPNQTEELKFWYPNSWLISGRDILFFWDARMIMAGLELVGEVPFKTLVLHGLVRDSKGRKLSKSLGNSPDPLELFDKFGTDAVRIAISNIYPLGRNDTRLGDDIFKNGQSVVIKLWNAAKFISYKLNDQPFNFDSSKLEAKNIEDCWLLTKLGKVIREHDQYLKQNDIMHASNCVLKFFRNDFCDWYIEIFKLRTANLTNAAAEAAVLAGVFNNILKLLHLYMPFVTEHIMQVLKSLGIKDASDTAASCLAAANWPQAEAYLSDQLAERKLELSFEIISGIRDVRHNFSLAPKLPLNVSFVFNTEEIKNQVSETLNIISSLASVQAIEAMPQAVKKTLFRFDGGVCYLELPAETDLNKAKDIILKKMQGLEKSLLNQGNLLQREEFIKNAPAELVEETRLKMADYEASIKKLKDFLSEL